MEDEEFGRPLGSSGVPSLDGGEFEDRPCLGEQGTAEGEGDEQQVGAADEGAFRGDPPASVLEDERPEGCRVGPGVSGAEAFDGCSGPGTEVPQGEGGERFGEPLGGCRDLPQQ
ncbi:hypothetical protein [Streptomyces sp. bgisy060]|uniref:hypothetical protein n=1 Tax=Streptomyces sp. bgisy060 TaxID=3413775 RepID=UPI003EBFCB01